MPIRDETTLNLLSEKEFGSAVDAVLKDDSGYRIKIADVRNSLESDPDYLEKYFPKVIELMTVPEAINTSEALKIIEKYGKRLGVVYAETHDFLRLETNFNDVWCTQAPSAKALAYAIFIRDYADIYKYHSVEMPDTDKVRLIREGLVAGIEALTKLKSERRLSNKPNEFDLEDRMTLFLIFGLCDPEAGDIDSAKALVETINNNFLKERAIKEIQLETDRIAQSQNTTWKKVERVAREEFDLRWYMDNMLGGKATTVGPKEVTLRATELKKHMTVSINMPIANLEAFLRTGQYKSSFQTSEYERRTYVVNPRYNAVHEYLTRLRQSNKSTSIMGKGTVECTFPIFGAAFSPGNPADTLFGASELYGHCFVVLKKECANNRTTFCSEDTGTVGGGALTTFEKGLYMKVLHDMERSENRGYATPGAYVEAQIHGGVRLEDVEEVFIRLPNDPVLRANYVKRANKLVETYPNIKIGLLSE